MYAIEMNDTEYVDESTEVNCLAACGFFGCYLLVSLNPLRRGTTYIGFTVNPNRRIRQHNAGRTRGGAKSTAGGGPWDMVLLVHGFPNNISALRFEWAWQHPNLSRRLRKIVSCRRSNETPFEYRFRILCYMLRIGPWNRLGLTIRWMNQRYFREFQADLPPPLHVIVAFGPLELRKTKRVANPLVVSSCALCKNGFQLSSSSVHSIPMVCPSDQCTSQWHVFCIAEYLLSQERKDSVSDSNSNNHLIPLSGPCPECQSADLFWPSLINEWRSRNTQI